MNKKVVKVILVFILSILLISVLNISNATVDTTKYKIRPSGNTGPFGEFAGIIVWILQFAGYTVAVIMLSVIGIKYIISSPGEKADLKSRLIPYGIGAVLLFAGSTFLNIIYNVVNNA